MKDDRFYLSNIAECIERIQTYTVDGYKAFMQTWIIQDAANRNLEINVELDIRLLMNLRSCNQS
jgi:uncharacterized protein with HEPN domain